MRAIVQITDLKSHSGQYQDITELHVIEESIQVILRKILALFSLYESEVTWLTTLETAYPNEESPVCQIAHYFGQIQFTSRLIQITIIK